MLVAVPPGDHLLEDVDTLPETLLAEHLVREKVEIAVGLMPTFLGHDRSADHRKLLRSDHAALLAR
jgi:hypothetical protein